MDEIISKALVLGPALIIAVVLHEIAHGYVADRLGDPTARQAGRLTLNPLAHVDLMGTIVLPGMLLLSGSSFLFGWAKPVPVRFGLLRNPLRDMVWVAAAGPIMNVFLAFVSATLLKLTLDGEESLWVSFLFTSLFLNVLLAVFNMIPVPPLDGGRVAVGLLPRPFAIMLQRLEPYGMIIVIGLLYTGALNQVLFPVQKLLLQLLLS